MRTLLLLFVLSAAAFAQPSAVGSGCQTNDIGGDYRATAACSLSVTTGNQLVISSSNFYYAITGITDDSVAVCGSANTYAQLGSTNGNNWRSYMYFVASIACTGTVTITASYSNTSPNPGPNIGVQQYHNVGATQEGSTVAGVATGTSNYTCGAITKTSASAIVLTTFSALNTGTYLAYGASSPFTLRVGGSANYGNQTALADDITSSATTLTPVFSYSAGTFQSANGCISVAMSGTAAAAPIRHRVSQ